MSLVTIALDYAGRGIPVFPVHTPRFEPDGTARCSCSRPRCEDRDKHPRTEHGLNDASTDPAQVAAWWRRWPHANIGARTGIAFDVCDVDGPEAADALRSLLAGVRLGGPLARTGRADGYHLLVRPTGYGNRAPHELPGVDWRGSGGYVVLPPSRHASGCRYTWIRPLGAVPLPEAPAALLRLLTTSEPSAPASPPPAASDRAPAWAQAALNRETAAVAAAPHPQRAQGRSTRAQRHAQPGCLQAGPAHHDHPAALDEASVRAALIDAAARCQLPAAEAQRTITKGLTAGQRRLAVCPWTGAGDHDPARQRPTLAAGRHRGTRTMGQAHRADDLHRGPRRA